MPNLQSYKDKISRPSKNFKMQKKDRRKTGPCNIS